MRTGGKRVGLAVALAVGIIAALASARAFGGGCETERSERPTPARKPMSPPAIEPLPAPRGQPRIPPGTPPERRETPSPE
jgi:hypothetical protein